MLIGLISDTHVRIPGTRAGLSTLTAEELPSQILKIFRGVDLILHAGDIYTLPVLDALETVAPVLAAEGDDDPFEVVNDRRIKHEQYITLEGVTIWVSHYGEWPENSRLKPPDVIVFGHSHTSALEKNDGVLRVNPGSPTFPRYQFTPGSVALMTVKSGKAEAEIIQLEGGTSGSITSGIPGITS
jgi:putative phosphoesterase